MNAKEFTVVIDDAQFQRAMTEYLAASGKDTADAVNRQGNNLAIQALKFTKKAEGESIRRMQGLEWWPKYVASVMSKRGRYTREQARAFSARLIRRRLVAVTFLKFFFVQMSRAVQPHVQGGKRAPGKSFAGFTAQIEPATPRRTTLGVRVGYGYRKRGDRTVRSAEDLLRKALDFAAPALIADMEQYVARKLQERARQFKAAA